MTLRSPWSIIAVVALAASATFAAAAGDPFAGTWESRVAWDGGAYTLRLRCKSASDCETRMIEPGDKSKGGDSALFFPSARPFTDREAMQKALRYALEHRAEGAANREFAAIRKLLAAAVDAKTEIDACVGLDDRSPDFFVVCTVRNATSWRPTLLFFGSLMGLCGQGFCKHVVYPLQKTGS